MLMRIILSISVLFWMSLVDWCNWLINDDSFFLSENISLGHRHRSPVLCVVNERGWILQLFEEADNNICVGRSSSDATTEISFPGDHAIANTRGWGASLSAQSTPLCVFSFGIPSRRGMTRLFSAVAFIYLQVYYHNIIQSYVTYKVSIT